MGEHKAGGELHGEELRLFVKRLLDDVYALEKMQNEGLIESGVHRIGAEQEIFLADRGGRPAPTALKVLELIDDPHFTTELALFNVEVNLDPLSFSGNCLSTMESDLERHLGRIRWAAGQVGSDIVLTGILPTLRKSDMGLHNITPLPRYYALNDATNALRGGPLDFRIKGVDELTLTHDSVMLEACNTSFQVHLQVGPEEFARLYNAAQVFSAPVISASANAPLLFGRRLWQETRIALFQQAVDTRKAVHDERNPTARVHFGRRWVTGTAVDLFKEDVTRFRVMLSTEFDEDPHEVLREGNLPRLKALCLHNGTIWRWNRPCYGVTNGKAHLRIENRVLASGPTVLDEVANAAFWLGLMNWAIKTGVDVTGSMEFETAKENFVSAARLGLNAQLTWLDGKTVPVQQLILNRLLPDARKGLQAAGVQADDIERYLDVIEARVSSGQTGAKWMLLSYNALKNSGTRSERLGALTRATIARQTEGKPVHEWNTATLEEAGGWKHHYVEVEQYMTTDLFTVREEDSVDLVANMMNWERIRHILVEDDSHRLVGLVSYRSLLRVLARGERDSDGKPLPVSAIMIKDPITVSPETTSLDAIELMRTKSVGCLPVVTDGRLVGVITERDFMVITRELLLQKLSE